MAKKPRGTLTAEGRGGLGATASRGKADARKLAHARAPPQAHEAEGAPARTDREVAAAPGPGARAAERVRRRFVEAGIGAALPPKPAGRVDAHAPDGET